jgi:predicted CXXCH cytochrome family protein
MKRSGIFCMLAAAILVAALSASAAPVSIVNTKHNLAYKTSSTQYTAASANPLSGGTDQVCVFCHTPHNGNTNAPLWNRSSTQSAYTPYSSDVMIALGINAENPASGAGVNAHIKTRICLTCHDGTVALGSLANIPNLNKKGFYTTVQMTGSSTIQNSSKGYIGLDLSDDHPVSVKQDASLDPELIAPPGGNVRLYKDSSGRAVVENLSGDYVECTSCHDAHDNEYGAFLVEPNTNAQLCRHCHSKYGIDKGSQKGIHNQSLTQYNASSGIPGLGVNVGGPDGSNGGIQCMICHYSHKAGLAVGSSTPNAAAQSGKYLLAFQQENTCFNKNPDRYGVNTNVCHDTGTSLASGDIKSAMKNNTAAHKVGSLNPYAPNLHGAAEVRTGVAAGWEVGNWHVECADCHNPHTAGGTSYLSSNGACTNIIQAGSSLYGAGFVSVPAWVAGWTSVQNFTPGEPLGVTNANESNYTTSLRYEYEICFKCHSGFASGNNDANFPQSASMFMAMTDQSREFNPVNAGGSFHPVVSATKRAQGTLVNTRKTWGTVGSNTMYCSDCHTSNGSYLVRPQGPHGSNNVAILSANYNDSAATTGNPDSSSDFCMTCHDYNAYASPVFNNTGGTGFAVSGTNVNLHTQHAYRSVNTTIPGLVPYKYRCVNCHIRITHGWSARRGMVLVNSDSYATTYKPSGAATALITALPSFPAAPAGYSATRTVNCTTATGCHN